MVKVSELDIESLYVGECNVRKSAGDITELMRSIEERGLLQPITVRPVGDRYEVIIGRRRYEACRALGLKKIPVIIREMSDDEAVAASLIENIQRGNLEPEEEAEAIQRLMEMSREKYGDPRKVAKALGLSEQTVRERLSILELLPKVRKGVRVEFAPSKEERRRAEAVPFEHAAIVAQAFKSEEVRKAIPEEELEKKQLELIKAIAPRDLHEARKIVDYFKMFPEKPIEVIVDEALAREAGVAIHVYFAPRVARALSRAAQDRGMSMEELVPIAVEEWLKQVGYL
jgi:ParB/RepB/Spo0J family partition protein